VTATLAGPPPRGPAPAHDGLFGPESVTWRVMTEPVMWIAAFRAFYLQALHPRVMRGTWQNTVFTDRDQAWGRFLRTTEFVRARTFGTMAEVERAGRRVRKLHASLRGTGEDGQQFRLDEPELLLWVHCGEVSSYADVARRAGLPLADGELDRFVDEQRRAAAVVGLDPASVPASVTGLADYFTAIRPRLRVTPEARQVVLRSLTPPVPPRFLPLKLMVPGVSALAFSTLPRWARRLYGMPGSPVTDLAASAGLRVVRETTRAPARLLILPAARQARDVVLGRQRAAS
jgi:uncharacterized protein (DUF2236 family)